MGREGEERWLGIDKEGWYWVWKVVGKGREGG